MPVDFTRRGVRVEQHLAELDNVLAEVAREWSMPATELWLLVVGPYVWGRARTFREALKQADRPKEWLLYACPSDQCYVSDYGALCWPGTGPRPVEVAAKMRRRSKS